jgi:hypothetical protein
MDVFPDDYLINGREKIEKSLGSRRGSDIFTKNVCLIVLVVLFLTSAPHDKPVDWIESLG